MGLTMNDPLENTMILDLPALPEWEPSPAVLCADCGEGDPDDGDDLCKACRARWDADEPAAHVAWLASQKGWQCTFCRREGGVYHGMGEPRSRCCHALAREVPKPAALILARESHRASQRGDADAAETLLRAAIKERRTA
jgi:hypothetical protein